MIVKSRDVGSVKISATMVGQRRKMLKLHWLKHTKKNQKTKLYQKINDSKPHIWSLSMNFRFSGRKSQSQQKLEKKITHFTKQFRSKQFLILRTSTHSPLYKIFYRNTAKKLTQFINFPGNMFLVGVRKYICTGPFLDAQELHSRSTWKANVGIFLYISVRNVCSRDVGRFYLVGG